MKTYSVKAGEIKREWHVIDADGKILGKIATEAAQYLMGKDKPIYSRHLDTGDYVMVINAAKVKVTGKKLLQKEYARHSGYAGGFRSVTLGEMLKTKPEAVIQHAVHGMLPQNRLGDAMIKKLKVYAGAASANKSAKKQAEA
jgi:large subunit ribosomal protein L13